MNGLVRPITPSISAAPALSAGNRFRRYKRESDKTLRQNKVRQNATLKELIEAYQGFVPDYRSIDMPDWYVRQTKRYLDLVDAVRCIECTAEDIEAFSIAIVGLLREDDFLDKNRFCISSLIGLYMSALINSSEERDFRIHTQHLGFHPAYLGYRNEKNLTILGSTGHCLGLDMLAGSITVEDDVEGKVGKNMRGGAIAIQGNVFGEVGSGMRGGEILVDGDAEYDIGGKMSGGNITIRGDVAHNLGKEMKGGSILVAGNAKASVGLEMEDGTILVKGSAGKFVGCAMRGGRIRILGDVGAEAGKHMLGGEIEMEGGYESLGANITGGRITHKGKLIAGK
jgi:formylmethanofuran dehydrogenase subunit C